MTPRRRRRSELAALALALAALLLAACGGGDEDAEPEKTAGTPATEEPGSRPEAGDETVPAEAGETEPAAQLGPVPSDYARREIPPVLLRLYLKAGRDLALDWWVIAAVDQIDLRAGNPTIPPVERIPGIGYSLAAMGAPSDNRAALAARAGDAYADRCLKLAGRYVDTVAEQRAEEEAAAGPARAAR